MVGGRTQALVLDLVAGSTRTVRTVGGPSQGRVAHWTTLPQRCSKNVLFEGVSRYGPAADRRSCGQCAIVFLGRPPRSRSSWGGMELERFGESLRRSPLDGHDETC